jgi:hypothetical protein
MPDDCTPSLVTNTIPIELPKLGGFACTAAVQASHGLGLGVPPSLVALRDRSSASA